MARVTFRFTSYFYSTSYELLLFHELRVTFIPRVTSYFYSTSYELLSFGYISGTNRPISKCDHFFPNISSRSFDWNKFRSDLVNKNFEEKILTTPFFWCENIFFTSVAIFCRSYREKFELEFFSPKIFLATLIFQK